MADFGQFYYFLSIPDMRKDIDFDRPFFEYTNKKKIKNLQE